ncbi:MAG: hypothetical protein M1836_005572 [Candelina mexicana]|nr:MAG: hypothetical protein M1836_005572 [Candelina mexicana]
MALNHRLPQAGPALPAMVLDNLLDILETQSDPGYTPVLEQRQRMRARRLRDIRPEVYNLLLQGEADNLDAISALRGNASYSGAGIYMHVVIGHDGVFRLYIGQSLNVAKRLTRHKSAAIRASDSSLHYLAVDASAKDFWVLLARCDRPDDTHIHKRLNIMEEWCCLNFQTLPIPQLLRYLLPGTDIFGGGHLNIASPLEQGYDASKAAIRGLRLSSDPFILECYRKLIMKGNRASHLVKRVGMFSKLKDGFVGFKVDTHGRIWLGGLKILVPTRLDVRSNDNVEVLADVTDDINTDRWCRSPEARLEDRGLRLGIRLRGIEFNGQIFEEWATNSGVMALYAANSFVDGWDGYSREEVMARPRRLIYADRARYYTK